MDILAREARHGDGLRMSTSGRKREPLVDENEDDWVRTCIIAGWSHGYLQMVSLLPAAERVIAMHADWIVEAFETAAEKELAQQQLVPPAPDKATSRSSRGGDRASSEPPARPEVATGAVLPDMQPVNVIPPTPVIADTVPLAPSTAPSPQKDTLAVHGTSALSDAEDEDEILTFTPKNRRTFSNASRSSHSGGASPPVSTPYTASPPTTQSPSAEETAEVPALGEHLVTTVERAMRDELHRRVPPAPASSAPTSRPTTPSRDAQTSSPASVASAPPASSPSGGNKVSGPPARTLSLSPPPAAANPRTGRSPSGSALPPPQGAVFIDARDLMRRRKEDVVYGIVSGAASRTSSPLPARKASETVARASSAHPVGHDEREGARFDRRRTLE